VESAPNLRIGEVAASYRAALPTDNVKSHDRRLALFDFQHQEREVEETPNFKTAQVALVICCHAKQLELAQQNPAECLAPQHHLRRFVALPRGRHLLTAVKPVRAPEWNAWWALFGASVWTSTFH
jgi:hypothetical protein